MSYLRVPTLTRRAFLASAAATAASVMIPPPPHAHAAGVRKFRLRASPGRTRIVPALYGKTDVWCYNGSAPGPEIRVRQGERVRIAVDNALGEEVSNAMDGVPHLTQAPITPGKTFTYEFDAMVVGQFELTHYRRHRCGHLLVSSAPAQFRAGRPRPLRSADHRGS